MFDSLKLQSGGIASRQSGGQFSIVRRLVDYGEWPRTASTGNDVLTPRAAME